MKPSDLELDVPSMQKAIDKALNAYQNLTPQHKDLIRDDTKMVVINMRAPSFQKRLAVYDLINHEILRHHHVAHGKGSSDSKNPAKAVRFSNIDGSHMSSLGAMITSDVYRGKHGQSLRLNGLEKGVNSNVRRRTIVVHSAPYMSDDFIMHNGRAGQSYGCPAVDPAVCTSLIQEIKNGVFFYVYF